MIGKTPLVKLNNIVGPDSADIYVKFEGANPKQEGHKHKCFNDQTLAAEFRLLGDRAGTIEQVKDPQSHPSQRRVLEQGDELADLGRDYVPQSLWQDYQDHLLGR